VELTRGSLEKPVLMLESDRCLSRSELPEVVEGAGDEAQAFGLRFLLQRVARRIEVSPEHLLVEEGSPCNG